MTDPVRPFSKQQLRVIDGIRRGLSYKQIGAEMGITEYTVKDYVKKIALILDQPSQLEPKARLQYWIHSHEWEATRTSTS